MSGDAIRIIALNEFKWVVSHPLLPAIALILVVLPILNAVGGNGILFEADNSGEGFILGQGDVFMQGLLQITWAQRILLSALAAFFGVTSMIKERSSKSVNILVVKPLYRRDIIIGKFLGICSFMLLFITFNLSLTSLLLAIFFRPPMSLADFALRICAYVMGLFLLCALLAAICIFAGIVFRNNLAAMTFVFTMLYVIWFTPISLHMGQIVILQPVSLYNLIIDPEQLYWLSNSYLFNTAVPFGHWLVAAAPYLMFMLLEVIAFILASCHRFAGIEAL